MEEEGSREEKGGKKVMLKNNVEKIINNGINEIQELREGLERKEKSQLYSNDYLSKEKNKLKEREIEITKKVIKDIEGVYEVAIYREKEKRKDTDNLETNNILKFIELTKDTLTEKEIEELLEDNKENYLVERALYGIAEKKGFHVSKRVDKIRQLATARDEIIRSIKVNGLNSMGTFLRLKYL